MPTPGAGAGHEIILAEEEISDVSLVTFYVFDKENTAPFRPNVQLARGGCGGGCGGGGCGGAVAGGAVAGGAAVAGVEDALAVEAVEAVEVAVDAPAFGPTGAAEAAWCALDVHQSGGVSRRRLQRISIRRRRLGHH